MGIHKFYPFILIHHEYSVAGLDKNLVQDFILQFYLIFPIIHNPFPPKERIFMHYNLIIKLYIIILTEKRPKEKWLDFSHQSSLEAYIDR